MNGRAGRFRSGIAVVLMVLVALGIAACGGDSSTSSTGTEPASNASAPSEGEGQGGSDIVAEAKKESAAAQEPPTKFEGPTEPVPAVKGISVAVLPCDAKLVGCVRPLTAVERIGKSLGWEVKSYDGQSNPVTWNQNIVTAINAGAEALFLSAQDPKVIQQGLAAAKAKDIPVVDMGNGGDTPNPVIEAPSGKPWTDLDVAIPYGESGIALANYIIAESGGEGSTLVINAGEFVGNNQLIEPLVERLDECGGCKTELMEIVAAEVTTSLPEKIVAHLRAHPDVDWIVAPFDAILGVAVPAIQSAGLADQAQAVGLNGNAQNLEFIEEGAVQSADITYDNEYMGYVMVDQALRLLNGQKLAEPHGENVPWYLVTKDNLPSSDVWIAPFDYKAEFERLWGIGG